jgi:hypothetical protein
MLQDHINEWITPFVSGAVALILSLWIKDTAGRIVRGMAFKFSSDFAEGDKVILDGEEAIVVKIGFSRTVFGIYRTERGSTEITHYWRYVPNERIPYLHIERVINDHRYVSQHDDKGENK